MGYGAQRFPVRATIVAATLVLAGCEIDGATVGVASTGPAAADGYDPWLVPDRTTYVARYTSQTVEVAIPFHFQNRSRVPVAIPACTHPRPPVLDKLVAGEWVEVYTPLQSCWAEPLVVAPGRSVHATLRVRAGLQHTTIEPRFRTSRIPGTYRLRWEAYRYEPHAQFRIGAALPLEHRVSGEFRIMH
jgi:hypothetical protein